MVMRESQISEKDSEFDWRDRLRQWKQMQQSAGSVTSFTDSMTDTFQSTTISILGILQSHVTHDQLRDRVE